MQPSFIIFSGLPGTGKSALADRLAREFHLPLLRIDDLADCMPSGMDRNTTAFWDQAIFALLLLAESQLRLGVSVIADSIFMNSDRSHASAIAQKTGTRFLPVHTFISDEAVWEARVNERFEKHSPGIEAASWEQVTAQRRGYRPWEPGTALFVDAVRPLDENYALVKEMITGPTVEFKPLPDLPFTPGKYHG
jgi:predicted kinase